MDERLEFKKRVAPKLDNVAAIREHYRRRLQASRKVQKLLHLGVANDYAVFALGISPEGLANYSAAERRPSGGPLNHRIRAETADSGIIRLAGELSECPDAQAMIECIYHENFPWLKISVGSEMAMMLRPKLFCVCNVRTMWAYMLVDNKFEFSKANEELRLYHEQQSDDDDRESQMAYRYWKSEYHKMVKALEKLALYSNAVAEEQGITPGKGYLWYDCLANALYEKR